MSHELHRQAAKASALELCADWAAVKGIIQENPHWVLKAQRLSGVAPAPSAMMRDTVAILDIRYQWRATCVPKAAWPSVDSCACGGHCATHDTGILCATAIGDFPWEQKRPWRALCW